MDETQKSLYKQGAEGKLYKIDYQGKPAILKERFQKKYRNAELDERLTKERIRAESKSIQRCKNVGIRTPDVYRVDLAARQIIVEYIDNSKTVSERIYELTSSSDSNAEEKLTEIAVEMGKVIGKMHDSNIIHGDLTTSNILIQFDENDKWNLCLIDFGLSYTKASDEDKAVDLYVLQRALTSKHDDVSWFFDKFLISYRQFSASCERIMKKFNEVCSRGRKRTMIG